MATERDETELRDAQLSARYRELAQEEPPARLDAAILGAARARASRHPAGVRRWAVPVSLAAVVVLSVLVTTRIQEQAPDLESLERPPIAPVAKPTEPVAPPRAEGELARPAAKEAARPSPPRDPITETVRPAARTDAAPQSVEKGGPVPFAAPAPTTQAPARAADLAIGRTSEPSAAAAAGAPAQEVAERSAQEEPPAAWLERIARLRSEGRNAEADESFAEFRRRYPDYRIPEEMRMKVLPR